MTSEDIKRLRFDLGLTQSQLADKIGVSIKTITNYENGGVIPKSKEKIIELLRSSISLDRNNTTIKGNNNNIGHGNSVVSDSKVSYGNDTDEVKFLRLENESLKKQIEDKDKIISLYEKMINK